jgi:NAD(P)H-dependent flavin oxidoreductase YrpB (nitropropane dioxygenase family)
VIRTKLTERYGLKIPFVSAGMGFIALPPLAAAVSNAGGLGQLACGAAPAAVLHEMIIATRERTSRPFAVNFLVETTAFGTLTTEAHIVVCIEDRVPVVAFFWTSPPDEWVRRLKEARCDVWLQTSSIAAARAAISSGVDIIIAQGSEAGGHNRSTTALFTLLPRMVDAVNPVPVVAAGGIADGRGMAAALCLGAAGVCVGTRLVATIEANAHEEYKRRIVQATEEDITRTCIFGPEWPDAPMRVIRNRVVREWAGNDTKTPPQPDPPQIIGKTILGGREYAMPKFAAILPTPETTGDFEEMCLAAGESAALTTAIITAQEVVQAIGNEAERILEQKRPSGASMSTM